MHALKEFTEMPLEELAELAYAVQIPYEPPLKESDRKRIIDALMYLIINIDDLQIEEILTDRIEERKERGIKCFRINPITDVCLLYYSDQQLIFYALDSNVYSCYTRFDVVNLMSTGIDPYTNKRITSSEKFLFEQLLKENDYPDMVVYDFVTEINNRLGKYRHDRKYHYDNSGKIRQMEKYKNGKVEYVKFYENGFARDKFYV